MSVSSKVDFNKELLCMDGVSAVHLRSLRSVNRVFRHVIVVERVMKSSVAGDRVDDIEFVDDRGLNSSGVRIVANHTHHTENTLEATA